jgi:hypothetical protein
MRFTVLVRDGVAEGIRVLTGGETVDEVTPLTGDETIKVSSMMEGIDDEISPLTGDETNKVFSVMEGADEEITATDGGSAEKTSETSCTDLEKMSFAEEIGETELETDWTGLEKILIGGEPTEMSFKEENNEDREG